LAGAIGTRWNLLGHTSFFLCMAALASTAALLLKLLDPAGRRAEAQAGADEESQAV